VYWSHLEEDERTTYLTARMRYRPRPELLSETVGYTGFGCFPHGYRESCRPGGRWDQKLGGALQSLSYDGPWVIGEADYHRGDEDAQYRNVGNPVTVFALRGLTSTEALRALSAGRMYAYAGHRCADSLLRLFRVSDPGSPRSAAAGETFRSRLAPILDVRVSGFRDGCRIRVICGGALFADIESRELQIALPTPTGHGYACRAEILGVGGEHIVTNPTFVACPR
jgi:hypothetical protein